MFDELELMSLINIMQTIGLIDFGSSSIENKCIAATDLSLMHKTSWH